MKTTLQILIDARKLIEKPENWTQGSVVHLQALPTCASVAMDQVTRRPDGKTDFIAWSLGCTAVCTANDIRNLVHWNDEPRRTHTDVLSAFDAAIEAERAKVSA